MPELNFVSTSAGDPDGADGQQLQPYCFTGKPGQNYGGAEGNGQLLPTGDGFMEYGSGTPGSLPFQVDEDGNVTTTGTITAASIIGGNSVDWVNVVTAYGADPTGTNDSSTAFQNALTAIKNAGGGCLYIPTGNYKIGTALTYNANHPLRITGDGPAASVILANNSSSNITYLLVTSTSRFTADNFSLNNNVNSPAFSDTNIGIQLTSVTWASFFNVAMQTAAASNRLNQCVVLDNCTNVDFNVCDLRSYVNCVSMIGTTAAVAVRGGSFSQNAGSGVSTAAAVLMNVDPATLHLTNMVFNSGDRGVLMTGGSGANPAFVWMYDVEFNSISINALECDSGAEIWADSCWFNTTSVAGGDSAISIGSSFEGVAYFHQCTFQGWTEHTVALGGGGGYSFTDCTFGNDSKASANTYDEINVAASVSDITISGCHFNVDPYYGLGSTKPRSGVNIASGVTNYHVSDNIFATSYGTASCIDGTARRSGSGSRRNVHGFDYKDAGSAISLSTISNTEEIVVQIPIDPQDLLVTSAFRFRVFGQYTNGSTSATNDFRLRAGTAGTTSDTQVCILGNTSYSSTATSANIVIEGSVLLSSVGSSGAGKGWLVAIMGQDSYSGGTTTFVTANVSSWNTTTSVWLTLTFQTNNASNTLAVTTATLEKVV